MQSGVLTAKGTWCCCKTGYLTGECYCREAQDDEICEYHPSEIRCPPSFTEQCIAEEIGCSLRAVANPCFAQYAACKLVGSIDLDILYRKMRDACEPGRCIWIDRWLSKKEWLDSKRWGRDKNKKYEKDREHQDQLLRFGLYGREHPNKVWWSFCRANWVDEDDIWHCNVCKQCQDSWTWHCKGCDECHWQTSCPRCWNDPESDINGEDTPSHTVDSPASTSQQPRRQTQGPTLTPTSPNVKEKPKRKAADDDSHLIVCTLHP